jgi:hypothetical protein
MALKNIFAPLRKRALRKTARDWSNSLTPRDWADLPVYHPRREEDAI